MAQTPGAEPLVDDPQDVVRNNVQKVGHSRIENINCECIGERFHMMITLQKSRGGHRCSSSIHLSFSPRAKDEWSISSSRIFSTLNRTNNVV